MRKVNKMTRVDMMKELILMCCDYLSGKDKLSALEYWSALTDEELAEELADLHANEQMAKDEGRWVDGGCNWLSKFD